MSAASSAPCTPRPAGQPMDALETLAGQWLDEHPEYHADLADADAAVARMYDGEDGRTNPVPASVHAPVDQRTMLDRPAARHPPGGRVAGRPPQLAARRASRGHGVPGADAVGEPALGPAAGRRSVYRMRSARAPRATEIAPPQAKTPRCGALSAAAWLSGSGSRAWSATRCPASRRSWPALEFGVAELLGDRAHDAVAAADAGLLSAL